jgi:hypothetical protein
MSTETKAPEVETVTMDDGRVVEFTGKSRAKKESFVKTEADGTHTVSVRIDFRNGETRTFSLPTGKMFGQGPTEQIVLRSIGHGLEQKLGDSYSGITDIDDAIEVVDQLMTRLGAGDWTAQREGGSGLAGVSILCKALVEATGLPVEKVREQLTAWDAKTKAALRASPEVAPIVKRLEAEKAARAAAGGKGKPAIDTSSLLAGLKASAAPA